MARRSLLILCVLLLCLSSCSGDKSPAPLSPDGTTPEGLWLMVMNDCDGDCEEPRVGMGGRFYHVRACEPVDEVHLGDPIAIADPASVIGVPYEMARPIVDIEVEQAVAIGPKSPTACDSRDLHGWFATRSLDYYYDDELSQRIADLAPRR